MSKLNDLIAQLCPNGVEHRLLLSVADVLYGYPCDASLFNTDGVGLPLARIRDVLAGRTDTYTVEQVPERYFLSLGDLLVGMDGNFHVANWKTDGGILCQRVCKITSKDNAILLNGFLSHLLKPIMKRIEDNKHGGTVKHLLDKDIKAIQIPVPPLPVQAEIVRILDNFTELTAKLTAELTAELTARQQQYEHYRNKLLHLDGEHITIQELFDTRNGFTPSKDNPEFWENGELPWFKLDDINAKGRVLSDSYLHITPEALKKSGLFPENSIIISTSATIGEYALITVPFLCNQRFISMTVKPKYKEKVDIKYLMHYCPMLSKYCKEHLNQGNFASVDMKQFVRFEFVIPPLGEQKRIVAILDRFDALCNDITEGLPAEIEARKKQYDYYRDKLLTFKGA